MTAPLDEIDLRILDELSVDARISMRALAERLHISRASAYARLDRLKDSGVVRGFQVQVDPVASGFGTTAYVTLSLNQADWREVRKRMLALEGVAHFCLVGGEFDVVLLVRARDNAGLRRIILDHIQTMPGVHNTRTLLVFEEHAPVPTYATRPIS
jgi:DNA-binding Lrp family transcriptional regulator